MGEALSLAHFEFLLNVKLVWLGYKHYVRPQKIKWVNYLGVKGPEGFPLQKIAS